MPEALSELRHNHHFGRFIEYVRYLREESVAWASAERIVSNHAELSRTIGLISAYDEILRLAGQQPLDKFVQAGESAPTEGSDRSDSNP